MPANITNVFVLMLENRSFDHMLGYSGITGTDAATGRPTAVEGPPDGVFNSYQDASYPATTGAPETMPVDPGHEFLDVLQQLSGTTQYPAGGPYPAISNDGFVSDYAVSPTKNEGNAKDDFGAIMRCYAADQLPVLNALARAFAVCDHWHAAVPGPTWPNRLFACCASAAGLDHSPSAAEILKWDTIDGFKCQHGSIFEALNAKPGTSWKIYSGDGTPMALALKGVTPNDIRHMQEFADAVKLPTYPYSLTWIEPNYGDIALGTFKGGNSQHPLDGVTGGEALIKQVYEAIRASPHWPTSLLILTWDEHGGFYDHVAPPAATPPGDAIQDPAYNQYGFPFDRLGVRVPAVIVSPQIRAGTIDHRTYDHSSIPATIEAVFGLNPLTARDAASRNVLSLLTEDPPRQDAPVTLPEPAAPGAVPVSQRTPDPAEDVSQGSLPVFLHVALRHATDGMAEADKQAELQRARNIQTRQEAANYIEDKRPDAPVPNQAG